MSTVLIDTSVWIDHFRRRNEALVQLVEQDQALIHPMVLAELACGTPPEPRQQTLGDLGLLLAARQATLDEVVAFVERERLYGLGCGFVLMILLPPRRTPPAAPLRSRSRRLAALAGRLGVGYVPSAIY